MSANEKLKKGSQMAGKLLNDTIRNTDNCHNELMKGIGVGKKK